MRTIKMTMAQALVRFLDHQYIHVDGEEIKFVQGVLGIFGHGNVLGLGEALEAEGHCLKYYQGKNEQGMAHVALGFTKQKRRKQMMAVTSSIGPGALNMVTAAGTATANRLPVLFLPGDAYATRQPDPVLQQIEQPYDYNLTANDAFKPVSKYWDRVNRPEQLMTACINAMRVLTDPAETGAVVICLPQDVEGEVYEYPEEFLEKRVHYIQRRAMDSAALERVVELICKKKKPFLLCGGGVRYSDAEFAFQKFAEEFQIPFGETQAGKGTILFDCPMNLGGVGLTGTLASNRLAKEADLIIGIGTRLNDFHTCSKLAYPNEEMEMIGINLNPMDAYKMNAMPVMADAKLALEAISKELRKRNYKSEYKNEITNLKKQWDQEVDRLYSVELKEGLAQTRVLGALNETLIPKDAIIVSASGSLPSDLQRVWRCRGKDVYHVEYGFSCMGYEISGALGAKIAEPEREVYAIVGDGSFLMLHSEFITSLQEHIKINVILMDNNGCQCIHNLQKGNGIPSFANEYRYRENHTDRLTGNYMPVDYAMIANGYGGYGLKARNIEELEIAFSLMKNCDKSILLDIKVVPETMTNGYDAWWRVGVAQMSAHSAVEKAAKRNAKNVKLARKF